MTTEKGVTGPMNLGNPIEYTILEIAEIIIDQIGSKSKIIFEPLPEDDPKQRQPDISFAKSELNWEANTQLKEGLKKTIQYFDQTLSNNVNGWTLDTLSLICKYKINIYDETVASLICKKGVVDNKVFLRVGCEWIDWHNPGFDPYSPKNNIPDLSKFSIVIGVSAITPISFD